MEKLSAQQVLQYGIRKKSQQDCPYRSFADKITREKIRALDVDEGMIVGISTTGNVDRNREKVMRQAHATAYQCGLKVLTKKIKSDEILVVKVL